MNLPTDLEPDDLRQIASKLEFQAMGLYVLADELEQATSPGYMSWESPHSDPTGDVQRAKDAHSIPMVVYGDEGRGKTYSEKLLLSIDVKFYLEGNDEGAVLRDARFNAQHGKVVGIYRREGELPVAVLDKRNWADRVDLDG